MLVVCLVAAARASYCTPPSCGAPVSNYAWYGGESSTGRYVAIGGVFAVHRAGTGRDQCGAISQAGVQNVEAFLWAVRTFKTRYSTPDINIRAVAVDSCDNKNRAVQQVLNLEHCQIAFGTPPVSPSHLLAFVGADTGEQAAALALELGRLNKTLVSPAASSAFLGDITKYPYFLRTVPSDGEQAKALVALLAKRKWKHVQAVLEEGDGVAEAFRAAVAGEDICIVQTHVIPRERSSSHMKDIVRKLTAQRQTRVVVVLARPKAINELLLAAIGRRGMFTWVGGNSWYSSNVTVEGAVKNVADGAVVMALRSDNDDHSDAFMKYFEARKLDTNMYNPWMTAYWEQRFGCSVSGTGAGKCRTNLQSLEGVKIHSSVSYTIKAVDAVLNGIVRALKNGCPDNNPLCAGFVNSDRKWMAIYDKIRSDKFSKTTGDTLDTQHEIYNYRAAHDNCAGHCYVYVRH